MEKADAGRFELDGLYMAAVLLARRELGPEGGDGREFAPVLAELGVTRAALKSCLQAHGEDLRKTLEWIGLETRA